MATMTITIPDDQIDEFVAYLSETYHYSDTVQETDGPDFIPNPESANQFAKRMIKENLHNGFKQYKERDILALADVQTGIDVT